MDLFPFSPIPHNNKPLGLSLGPGNWRWLATVYTLHTFTPQMNVLAAAPPPPPPALPAAAGDVADPAPHLLTWMPSHWHRLSCCLFSEQGTGQPCGAQSLLQHPMGWERNFCSPWLSQWRRPKMSMMKKYSRADAIAVPTTAAPPHAVAAASASLDAYGNGR